MKRYKLHDRQVHAGQKFNYRTGERWAVLDRETNRIVDEGTTRYEAQQAVNNWNAGLHDDELAETPEQPSDEPGKVWKITGPNSIHTAAMAIARAADAELAKSTEDTPVKDRNTTATAAQNTRHMAGASQDVGPIHHKPTSTEEYAVTITSQRTEDGVTTANTSTVAKFDSDGLNVEEVARAGYQGIVSYHLPEGAVAALHRIDRRGDWHLIVRSDQDAEPATSPYVGRLMEQALSTPSTECEWFAFCQNPAAGNVAHPVLGQVPTCQRCADKFELVLVPN